MSLQIGANGQPKPITEPVFVWESAAEPGLYGLCTNREFTDYQTGNWKFRGELSLVQRLRGLDRGVVAEGTAGGWPMSLRVDQAGRFIY